MGPSMEALGSRYLADSDNVDVKHCPCFLSGGVRVWGYFVVDSELWPVCTYPGVLVWGFLKDLSFEYSNR